jgi:hypothetical protein
MRDAKAEILPERAIGYLYVAGAKKTEPDSIK